MRRIISIMFCSAVLILGMDATAQFVAGSSNADFSVPVLNSKTRGYVLTHEHPMVALAFGGNYAYAGADNNFQDGIMINGYTKRCGGCGIGQCDHGEAKGNFIAALGEMGPDMGGHKHRNNVRWGPVHDSFSHMRYSTEWIREAFQPPQTFFQDTRMRIMVAYAVESEAMCETLFEKNLGGGGPGATSIDSNGDLVDGAPCVRGDSLPSLRRQTLATIAWAEKNSDFVEIAYNATDARRIVEGNKLAVILGVEADYTFGAEGSSFDPVDRLETLWDMGIRTFYIAHKLNSRLAGADVYRAKESKAGKIVRATQAISGCLHYDDAPGHPAYPLIEGNHQYCAEDCRENQFKTRVAGVCKSNIRQFDDRLTQNLVNKGDAEFNGFDIYPTPPGFTGPGGTIMDPQPSDENIGIERNELGLSQNGRRVVREAMNKGMLMTIDHTSSKARDEIRAISANRRDYPLNAFHNNPNAMLQGQLGRNAMPHPNEYDFDEDELNYVKDTGGIFGVRLGPINAREGIAPADAGSIPNCEKTATETAKVLAHLLNKDINLGYSLDFATVTQGIHSRTFRKCFDGSNDPKDRMNSYGPTADDGNSNTPFLTEGLSHIGMMKKFHRELEAVGLSNKYLSDLRNNGAEEFLRMWERSEARSGPNGLGPATLQAVKHKKKHK